MKPALSRVWILLAIACSGAALADCGKESHMSIADLQGKWVLESISDEAVEFASEIYFEIDGRTVSGFDGCNNFGGPLDDPLQMRMSQRACAEEPPPFPLELSAPLAQLESARLRGDVLEVDLAGETGKARFRRQRES